MTAAFDIDVMALRTGSTADRPPGSDAAIAGRTPAMKRVADRLAAVAASEAPVLVTGECGTGRELVARSLHERSPRAREPFVAVHCAAYREGLLEAALLGGSRRRRPGRFVLADRGTLFLDDVAAIPLIAQVKLLRVLQDGIVEPVGTDETIQVDVRVISAARCSLRERIAQGLFREDLYQRLKVLEIAILPLRERRGDLPVLVQHCLHSAVPDGAPVPVISPRAWAALSHYAFPGDVHELGHLLHSALVLSHGGALDLEHFPSEITRTSSSGEETTPAMTPLSVAAQEFERQFLLRALALAGGRKTVAARNLGISRKNLWEKLKVHRIGDTDTRDPMPPRADAP